MRYGAAARAGLATVFVASTVPVHPVAAAAVPAPCPASPPSPVVTVTDPPWAQQRFEPERLVAFTGGRRVTVAVIDSGVDAEHPQLHGRVLAGLDYLDQGGDGRQDCIGHGTAVASLIAAQPAAGTAFTGLAPAASILPIRVSEQVQGSDQVQGSAPGRMPARPEESFARSIRAAVDRGAKVINLSVVLGRDDPEVRAATAYAIAHDVVVVAAVGNAHAEGDPVPYPAAYDGVIGVGAIDRSGVRHEASQVGGYVDLVAPGVEIMAAAPGHGHRSYQGTSVATPFVAAAAALVFQYRPELTAREVTGRLLATADPAPGPPGSPEYGRGVVNPYRALTEVVSSPPAGSGSTPAPPPEPVRPAEPATGTRALTFAAAVGALSLLVVVAAGLLPRGRRRGWRPGT